MANPAVSNTLVDGTTISAGPLNTNFSDIINSLTDGTKTLTIASVVSPTATFSGAVSNSGTTTLTGSLDAASIRMSGARTPGWTCNLGLTLAGGILTIKDSLGSALSSSNFGYVTVPSATAGLLAVLKVTSGGVLNDVTSGISDLTNLGFGITETANWANAAPFFLYVANRSNSNIDGIDGSSVFFLARSPSMNITPSSANDIGDIAGIPVNDSQNVILILQDVTIANYTSLPCQLIGAVAMTWSSATTDWTIRGLGYGSGSPFGGLGSYYLDTFFSKQWTFPTGQNGAASGNYLLANGGTAPAWSTTQYSYYINRLGECRIDFDLNGDGGTDGAGAVASLLTLPYQNISYTGTQLAGLGLFLAAATIDSLLYVFVSATPSLTATLQRFDDSAGALLASRVTVNHNQFTNGNRRLGGSITYKAF